MTADYGQIDRIRLRAEQGDARAQVRLGECCLEGRGAGLSETEAAAWFARAAGQNDPDGTERLGYCCLCGRGVAQDFARAAELYGKAEELRRAMPLGAGQLSSLRRQAELGDPDSQARLGQYCLKCSGGGAEGIQWLKLAARQNHAEACLWLGDCCRLGKGADRDRAEAFRWYRLAAGRGLSRAKHALGNCYYTACGVGKDLREAVRWFRRAAGQGLAASQYTLGEFHFYGIGVRRDLQTAAGYYRKAARHRWLQSEIVAKARCRLGLCYMRGEGVPQDGFEAAKWFVGAIEEGSGEAARHLTKLRLTLEQKDRLFYRRPVRTGMRNRPCSAHITKG